MAELTLVTREQLLRELTEIAEQAREENSGEDFTYVRPTKDGGFGCKYVHDEDTDSPKTGCLFGRWAHEKRGIPLARLAGEGVGLAGTLNGVTIVDLARHIPELGLQQDSVLRLARSIQHAQDRGESWLNAIRESVRWHDAAEAGLEDVI